MKTNANMVQPRLDVVSWLEKAVGDCAVLNGGVVAIVGVSGSGKSVAVQQYVAASGGAVRYFDGTNLSNVALMLPDGLAGSISVIDEPQQFANLKDVASSLSGGVLVLVCQMESEAEMLAGRKINQTLNIATWRSTTPAPTLQPA